MIELLKSAGDLLRAALDNYSIVFSKIEDYHNQAKLPQGYPPELTNQIDIELAFLSSYESKIQEIKRSISRARNYSSSLAPVNTLPSEILIRVLQLLVAEPCGIVLFDPDYPEHHPPRYLDRFVQVCSLWRTTALSTPLLWCHIDLTLYGLYRNGFISRAFTYADRAGDLPIELHVGGKSFNDVDDIYNIYDRLSMLFFVVSDRVETLKLDIPGVLEGLHHIIFRDLFSRRASNLTKLVVHSRGSRNAFFCANYADAAEMDEGYGKCGLDLSEDILEDGFAPITVLHLRGIFPRWWSTAYHGLVDLRLLSTASLSRIRETDLLRILGSSPGLRILHFELEISHSTPATGRVVPVHLSVLQVIKIYPRDPAHDAGCLNPAHLLRLLAPGSKPLRLFLGGYYQPTSGSDIELAKFFSRAKVARFCIQETFPPMRLLLRNAPHLEQVILDAFVCYNRVDIPPAWLQLDDLASLPRLRSLHITRSYLFEREFRLLFQCCLAGIMLHSSHVSGNNSIMDSTLSQEELLQAYPTVKISDRVVGPFDDPTADWDIFD
ncbi:unnamed protein product [Rhizoctonia solani]|uniref:F-box domain-containing protein n=1 Tax=Rhizoctonia solani TaxID=456999 RepID=A0A8H2Y425_9AGAM|nr:unnamed protein product [Rhizoctonia solani]